MKLKLEGAKKFFKETKAGKLISSAVVGAVKGVPFIGNVATEIDQNYNDELTGKGTTNKTRLAAYLIVGILMVGRIVKPDVFNAELFNNLVEVVENLAK